MSQNPNDFCFEDFRLNTSQRGLFRAGQRVALTRTEYEALLVLLEAGGAVILKEEMYKRLWGERQVEDSNLFQHIRALRKKLGTSAGGQIFIETVYGLGYRFSAAVTSGAENASASDREIGRNPAQPDLEVSEPVGILPRSGAAVKDTSFATKSAKAVESLSKSIKPWERSALISLGVFVLVLLAILLLVPRKLGGPNIELPKSPELMVVNVPETQAAPRLVRSIKVKSSPACAVLGRGGKDLYVAEVLGNSISVIDTATARVTNRIRVGHRPSSLALSPDGRRLYVGQRAGGLTIVDTARRLATAVDGLSGPVNDVVATRDGKSAYLALGFSGLAKLDVTTGSVTAVSKIVYTEALALTRDDRRLYVSYQAGGPGGSPGHDAIGYFDTATGKLAGIVPGKFPNVGGCLSLSPSGSQIWENGGDACSSPRYDHEGCPSAPAGLMNIFDLEPHSHIRSIGLKGATMGCVTFSPRGEVALVGMSDHLLLVRSNDLHVIGTLPASSGKGAFTEDGAIAYVPLTQKATVAVIQTAIPVRAFRLTNRSESDGTFLVAIPSTRELEAKFIDPATLRVGKGAVKRTPDGLSMASVETITGYEGVTLIVSFNTDVLKAYPDALLEGTTYSGMPIRGSISSR